MASLMAEVKTIELDVERHVELDAFDIETLLVSWLSELLWLHEESEAIFVRSEIEKLTATQLEATVWGGPVSHQWNHIKAVTFHDLNIAETDQGYEVTLVFDV
jgi:SHS2 domain-containing protein